MGLLASVVLSLGLLAAAVIYFETSPRSGTAPSLTTGTRSSLAINGTRYWSGNLALSYNLTSISFEGITFNFSYPCNFFQPGEYAGCRAKLVNMLCPKEPIGGARTCQGTLPQTQVVFPDGREGCFNKASMINGTIWYDIPKSYPWFTSHSNPRVGIELVTNHAPPDTLTLLVSA